MSGHDKFDPPKIKDEQSPEPGDDRLQIDLRLGLDAVAAAEEEQLRHAPPEPPGKYELIDLASKLYDARRGRDRMFSKELSGESELFGEPAWDMLLALFCFPSRGILLGVTSLSHAAHVPPATGLRWQKLLEQEDLIERGPRVPDSRVQLVGLSATGRTLMERYLTRLFHCQGSAAIEPE